VASIIDDKTPLESPTPVGGATKGFKLTVEHQEQTKWCWAAVSSSVARFYEGDSSDWTQCKIASTVTGADCCASPDSAKCNVEADLGDALEAVHHFHSPSINQPIPMDSVISEINNDRPVCVRIVWPAGNGHYVIIVGYCSPQTLQIEDPSGSSIESLDYEQLAKNYQLNGGQWTDTYPTRG
jgi:hypothetical protein